MWGSRCASAPPPLLSSWVMQRCCRPRLRPSLLLRHTRCTLTGPICIPCSVVPPPRSSSSTYLIRTPFALLSACPPCPAPLLADVPSAALLSPFPSLRSTALSPLLPCASPILLLYIALCAVSTPALCACVYAPPLSRPVATAISLRTAYTSTRSLPPCVRAPAHSPYSMLLSPPPPLLAAA